MKYTTEKIDTEITLLPSLLTIFPIFHLRLWYRENVDEKIVENLAIRCSNCGRSTGISTNNTNTNYDYIISQFVLNTMLHHIDMSWIIKKNTIII